MQLSTTTQLQVFGTYNDGSRNQVKTGIAWSSSAPTIASIGQTSGVLTGVQTGTATITADAQGLSSTATATVFLSGVTAITVTPSAGSVSIQGTTVADFKANATANGISVDITGNGATWTITPSSSFVTCTFVTSNEQCSATSGATTGTYTITVGYPGTTVVGTATLTVNP